MASFDDLHVNTLPYSIPNVLIDVIGFSIHVGINSMIKRKESEAGLISLPEMAERLGVPPLWLREQSEAGRVPCLRVGRKLMFHSQTAQTAVLAMAGDSFSAVLVKIKFWCGRIPKRNIKSGIDAPIILLMIVFGACSKPWRIWVLIHLLSWINTIMAVLAR